MQNKLHPVIFKAFTPWFKKLSTISGGQRLRGDKQEEKNSVYKMLTYVL